MLHRIQSFLENAKLSGSGKALLVEGIGYLLAWGTTVPIDAEDGYAPGCLFIHTDGSGANDVLYVNIGTESSCNFDAQEVNLSGAVLKDSSSEMTFISLKDDETAALDIKEGTTSYLKVNTTDGSEKIEVGKNIALASGVVLAVTDGGSATVSTGVGSIKMSNGNAADNSVWIPISYAGTTVFVPGFAAHAPAGE